MKNSVVFWEGSVQGRKRESAYRLRGMIREVQIGNVGEKRGDLLERCLSGDEKVWDLRNN